MKKLIIVFTFLFPLFSIGQGEVLVPLSAEEIAVGATLTLEPPMHRKYSPSQSVKSNLGLRLFFDADYASDAAFFEGSKVCVTVAYHLELYNGTTFIDDVNSTISITFDQSAGPNYDYKDIVEQWFDANIGANKAELSITAVSLTNCSPTLLSRMPNNVRLELFNQYTVLSFTPDMPGYYATAGSQTNGSFLLPEIVYSAGDRALKFTFPYQFGISGYEFDWVFVSDGAAVNGTAGTQTYDWKQANRILIDQCAYSFPLTYPKGWLVYRYRPVWTNPLYPDVVQRGTWNYAPSTLTLGTASSNDNATNDVFFHINNTVALDPALNWEYVGTYAENSMRVDAVSFYDGLGKPRQTVQSDNANKRVIISEVEHDYAGRAALQTLPLVKDGSAMQYQSVNDDFDPASYFADDKLNGVDPIPPFTNDFADYYSAASPITDDFKSLVPNASGYVFSQVKYKNDGTGRVIENGGVGSTYALNSGHNATYTYTRPIQYEIDRLFGNEVGMDTNYSKEYMVDANNQVHVTYKNGAGQVIAQGLQGAAPANLVSIAPAAEALVVDLFPSKNIDGNFEIVDSYTLSVPNQASYTFDFSLSEPQTSMFEYLICPTIYLDLYQFGGNNVIGSQAPFFSYHVIIQNSETGAVEYNHSQVLRTGSSAFNFDKSANLSLEPGTYIVSRTVEFDEKLFEQFSTDFIAAITNTDKVLEYYRSPVYGPSRLCVPFYVPTDTICAPEQDCQTLCEDVYSFQDALGNWVYLDEQGNSYSSYNPQNSADPVTIAIANCVEACNEAEAQVTPDLCETKFMILKGDMSPGGQYFENVPPRLQYSGGELVLGVDGEPSLSTSIAATAWLTTNVSLSAFIADVLSELGQNIEAYSWYDIGQGDAAMWTAIKLHWNDEWGDVLARYHPEYPVHAVYCACPENALVLNDYVNQMHQGNDNSFATAASGYYNPLKLSVQNSFQAGTSDNSTYINYGVGNTYDEIIVDEWENDDLVHDICEFAGLVVNGSTFNFEGEILTGLQEFISFDISSTTIHHSIWYFIEDPYGIAGANGGNNSGLPAQIIDIYDKFHGDGTSTDYIFATINKYEFFRSVYLFYREKVMYDYIAETFTNSGATLPSHISFLRPLDDNDYDTYTYTQNGARLVYPPNELFDNFSSFQLGNTSGFGASQPAYPIVAGDIDDEMLDCFCSKISDALDLHSGNYTSAAAYLTDQGVMITATELQDYEDIACNGMGTPGDLIVLSPYPYFSDCIFGAGDLFAGISQTPVDYCSKAKAEAAWQLAYDDYTTRAIAYADNYLSNMRASLINYIKDNEVFTFSYDLQEYQFTLYYYDQAGNLIKTVPPAGVNYLSNANTLKVQDHREDPQGVTAVYPTHDYQTNYKYNTLNQLVEQFTPDGGKNTFYYDKLGRLVFSQNAEQATVGDYSYSLYDALGRPIEGGVCNCPTTTLISARFLEPSDILTCLNENGRTEVTYTQYDLEYTPYPSPATGVTNPLQREDLEQTHLNKRVSASLYYDDLTAYTVSSLTDPAYNGGGTFLYPQKPQSAQIYSYDPHGNVNKLFLYQHDLESAGFPLIRMEYSYDLLSGNVNEFVFQPGTSQSLHQRYVYDPNNRLQQVFSSRNGFIWNEEATYYYYAHGPLARVEIGNDKLQGIDYAYTLQGWLKGINGAALLADGSLDMGDDGIVSDVNQYVSKDALAYGLGYFSGDYSSSGAANFGLTNVTQATSLYNGNIAYTSNQFVKNDGTKVSALFNWYTYDQLNRIKTYSSGTSTNLNNAANASGAVYNGFGASYAYDGNGNLSSLNRVINGTATIDQLTYAYTTAAVPYKRNRLESVNEANSLSGYGVEPGATAYQYDARGNLVADPSANISTIDWNAQGKVTGVTRSVSAAEFDMHFEYDPMGNRIKKAVDESGGTHKTIYIRDASGNHIATFNSPSNFSGLELTAYNLFGSSRLGEMQYYSSTQHSDLLLGGPYDIDYTQVTGRKGNASYELSNHLGNVMSVVGDQKICGDCYAKNYFFVSNLEGWIPNTSNAGTCGATSTSCSNDYLTLTWNGGKIEIDPVVNDIGAFVEGIEVDAFATYVLEFDAEFQYSSPTAGKGMRIYVQQRASSSDPWTNTVFDLTEEGHQRLEFYVSTYHPTTFKSNIKFQLRYRDVNLPAGYILTTQEVLSLDHITLSKKENHYVANVLSAQDYYPFGMQMPGRTFAGSEEYRYGFQGEEQDDEVKGEGNSIHFTFREYDPRVGRFFAVDPLTASYPYYTPYQFSGNRPIDMIELEGLEPTESGSYSGEGAYASQIDENGNVCEDTECYKWTWDGGTWNSADVMITNLELTTLFPNANGDNLRTLETTINLNGSSFGITGNNILAHYLGQAGHETGGFSKSAITESLYYTTASRVKAVFGSASSIYLGVAAEEDRIAKATAAGDKNIPANMYLRNSENFANLAYANKIGNGNEASGDGFLFRGRGYFQLTGRSNYSNFTNAYNQIYGTSENFISNPSKVATNRDIAIKSSLWFFQTYTIPKINNGSSFKRITKTVNAAAVGIEERQNIYNQSLNLLTF
jgi:RHS repeat-associated protein